MLPYFVIEEFTMRIFKTAQMKLKMSGHWKKLSCDVLYHLIGPEAARPNINIIDKSVAKLYKMYLRSNQ